MIAGSLSVSENIGGPVRIIKMMKDSVTTGVINFFSFVALISVLLGFFNLLPIPALDGGHIIFTLIEMIRRKSFKVEIIQKVQFVGFVVLMGLIVLVTFNDIVINDAFGLGLDAWFKD